MAEAPVDEGWARARLIPVSGIKGSEEQERRATSALLAVLSAVDEFGTSMTKRFGAPKGSVETYIEVPFELGGERQVIPDGLVRVRRGRKVWVALIEVKTGKNDLAKDQVESYLDVAREQGFDCVITISNQIPKVPGEHPVTVDKRKLRKVELHHLSWSRILTEAVMEKTYRGVEDEDQAWILGELIRYLEHPKAGAMDFDDMGGHWVAVRDAASAGTLRATDKKAPEVAGRWEELVSFAALRLGRELGADVREVLSRKERDDPAVRVATVVRDMAERGELNGAIRIPNTVGDMSISADLRAQKVTASISVKAPEEGRSTTRVKWLTRQLKDAPGEIRIDAYGVRSRSSMSELIDDARRDPDLLVPPDGRELGTFVVSLIRPMGAKRGSGRASFIDSVLSTIDDHYAEVVQNLKEWTPPTPKLQRPPAAAPRAEAEPAPSTPTRDSATTSQAAESSESTPASEGAGGAASEAPVPDR